jgi:hypothetical protein
MSRIYTIFTTILLASIVLTARPLFGQLGLGGNPPLSPWLNLYNRSPGPVDNYHMYVQPAQQLQNTLQSQQMGINHNAAALNSVSDQFSSQADAYYATASPTGNGAGFMNQSRYFNNNGMGGAGVFGMPGTGGLGRPGGVGQFGTPGLGGAAPGGFGAPAVRGAATGQGMGRI